MDDDFEVRTGESGNEDTGEGSCKRKKHVSGKVVMGAAGVLARRAGAAAVGAAKSGASKLGGIAGEKIKERRQARKEDTEFDGNLAREGVHEITRDPIDEYDWKAMHKAWAGASMMSPVWVALGILVVSAVILCAFLFRPMW